MTSLGRPKKSLDVSLILKLKENGLSLRKIAEEYENQTGLKVNFATISRLLHKSSVAKVGVAKIQRVKKQKKAIRVKQKSSEINTHTYNTTPYYPLDFSFIPISQLEIPDKLKAEEKPLKIITLEDLERKFDKAHSNKYKVASIGHLPRKMGKTYYFGKNRNIEALSVETERVSFNIVGSTITGWIKIILHGTIEEQRKKGEQIFLEEARKLSYKHNFKIVEATIKKCSITHHNIKHKPLNKLMIESLDRNKFYAEIGGKLGDTSHEDEVEFDGKNSDYIVETLSWLLFKFPNELRKMHESDTVRGEELEVLKNGQAELTSELRNYTKTLTESVIKTDERFIRIADDISIIKENIKNGRKYEGI